MLQLIRKGHELNAADLTVIFDIINKYDGSRGAIDKAKDFIQKAEDSLQVFDGEDQKTQLLHLAHYVVERRN